MVAVIEKVGGGDRLADRSVKTPINVDVVGGAVVIVDEQGDG